MGKPQAAEVATAFCMMTLRQTKNGTVSEPPPMPKMAEAQPMTPPAAISSRCFGWPTCVALGLEIERQLDRDANREAPMIVL